MNRSRHVKKAFGVLAVVTTGVLVASGIAVASPTSHKRLSVVQQGLAFYRGKTITIIEPGATGAIFDLLARTDAQYLGSYLHATVNVEDVTTGNTITGQDDTAGASPDGLTLGELNLGVDMTLALTHTPGLNFNPVRLAFISANAPSASLMIAAPGTFSSFDALVKSSNPKILMENTGTVDDMVASLFGILGVHPNYVVGYTSIGTYVQGFVRGDGPVIDTNLASTGQLVQQGKGVPIMTNIVPPPGTEYRSETTSIPTFVSIEKQFPPKTAKQKKEWAALDAFLGATSTPLVTGTAVAADKIAALRAAAQWMFKQKSYRTQVLAEGQNPNYVDPVTAKKDYATVLKTGSILEPFFSRFT